VLISLALVAGCATPPTIDETTVVKAGIGDGNVLAVGLLETYRAVLQIFTSGEYVLENPATHDFILYCPWKGDNWFFIGFNADGQKALNLLKLGNKAETFTFEQLLRGLEQDGWKRIAPTALPVWFSGAVSTFQAYMVAVGSFLFTPVPLFLIVPGGNLFNPFQEAGPA
jgi:hypothetical protein